MRILSIQYLRAIAALLVVVAHAVLHPLTYVDVTYRRMGSFGVLLFFVISGFIMVHTTGKGAFSPTTFLRRRIERIVPLYWVVTIGIAVVAVAAPTLLLNTTFSWAQLAASLLFIPYIRENGETVPLMKLGWTLNYEMFFYVAFAATASLTAHRRVLFITLLFAALVLIGLTAPISLGVFGFYTEGLILTFCVGMGIGLLSLHDLPALRSPRMAPVWATAAVVFIVLAFNMPPAQPLGPRTDVLFTLASGALILLGLSIERLVPVSRVGLTLGDASYAIYLLHMYFVAGSLILLRKVAGTTAPWLEVSCSIILSVLVSIPAHRYVELPLGRRLRHLRLFSRRSRAAA